MSCHFFISDLHLDENRPDASQAFRSFLTNLPSDTASLYILGDLFESWVGDDVPCDIGEMVIDSLSRLQERGIRCFFQAGNRDFLVGKVFSERSACQLLADYHCIEINGQRLLLMHGDLLCSDDRDYQQQRSVFRSKTWQREFLQKSALERLEFARTARARSQQHQAQLAEDIMDTNANTVHRTFVDSGVDVLIHGHTHKPGIHYPTIGKSRKVRIVLGDWYTQGCVLSLENDTFKLISLPT